MDDFTEDLLTFGTLVEDLSFIDEMRARLWQILGHTPRRLKFPGSQPVSFEKKHIKVLEENDYLVCEKSDGLRFLLYFTAPYEKRTAFLIDRQFGCRELEGLVLKKEGVIHEDSLLDGELICEIVNGKKQFSYLVFDCLLVNGVSILSERFDIRLKHVQNDFITPFLLQKSAFPFEMKIKKMWKSYGIGEVMKEIGEQSHGNDGLVFTPVDEPYQMGTCDSLLKWKPAELNTVDFKLGCKDGAFELFVASSHDTHCFYDLLSVRKDQEDELNGLDNQIIECRLSLKEETPKWEYVRPRKDKHMANHESVVKKILDSIQDNVKKEELIAACPGIRARWKEREALKYSKRLKR